MTHKIISGLLVAGLAAGGLGAAKAQQFDTARYEATIATARAYAADQTLINYCLRALGDKGPNLHVWAHDNLQEALSRMKAAGADPQQIEAVARVVMIYVRFFEADARDATLDPQCASRAVEQNVALLMGPAVPLHLRPPFRDFPR